MVTDAASAWTCSVIFGIAILWVPEKLRHIVQRIGSNGLTVFSFAVLACAPAIAAEAASGKDGVSRPPRQVVIPSGGGVKKAEDARKLARIKRSTRADAGGRPRVSGKTQGKPGTTRAAAAAKTALGGQSTVSRAGTVREPPPLHTETCMRRIDAEPLPSRIVSLVEECEGVLTDDITAADIRRSGVAAKQVMEVQRAAGLSADMFAHPEGGAEFQALIRRAARGDKQAAHQIADAYRGGLLGVQPNPRRMEQWLRFSAELGNGRASWELAEHYNYGGLIADAAKYERKAEELGFRPGVRLPSRGY